MNSRDTWIVWDRVRRTFLVILVAALFTACTEEDQTRNTMSLPSDYADAGVTPELYREWRAPRFGRSNPEIMSNPLWECLARSRASAYQVSQDLGGPSAWDASPGWCFSRFGQSETKLPDGRTVWIAGEHEDFYDPDFWIYNDVVVLEPDGAIVIYGYPEAVFPPTDFHSATLVRDGIVLIGNLGYADRRALERTQVLLLSLEDFSISQIRSSGTPPGWIHEHRAVLSEDGQSIVVSGGHLDTEGRTYLVENIDDWRLRLDDWRWERITDRQWPRWVLKRRDGEMNNLSSMRSAVRDKELGMQEQLEETTKALLADAGVDDPEVVEMITKPLDFEPDPELLSRLYRPVVAHTELPERDDEYGVYRIRIDGVTVRYVENSGSVQVTVEGKLPSPTIETLQKDLLEKLQRLEGEPWVLEAL